MNPFLFPDWTNRLRLPAGLLLSAAPLYLIGVVYLVGSPNFTDVGYQPVQPIDYSHKIHVGEMGMDCRYCHFTVENAAFAAIPPTATCLGCHGPTNETPPKIPLRGESPKLTMLRDVAKTDQPIEWIKVHDLPDFVYFNHSAHVNAGVGCQSCHGRIDTMPHVFQSQTLSMGWCLNCHRNPEPNLRPREEVTNMNYRRPEDQAAVGAELRKQFGIQPPTHCSGCHR
jgi:hypothetical protein